MTEKHPAVARLFYPAAACVMLAITLYAFQMFFLHGKAFHGGPLKPAIRTLLIIHGITMLLWLLLFIVQPTLIRLRKHKLHMRVGRFGAALAAVLVVLGMMVGVSSMRTMPPDLLIYGMAPKQFLYFPLTTISVFGAMVGLAVWMRKKPEVHRSLMLTATLVTISAAMLRIPWINKPFFDTIWVDILGPFHSTVLLGMVFLAVRCALIRGLDLWLAVAITGSAAVCAAMKLVSTTVAWDAFASFLMV